MATFSGWGIKNSGIRRLPRYLQEAQFEILSAEKCESLWDGRKFTEEWICANKIHGQGTCTVSISRKMSIYS